MIYLNILLSSMVLLRCTSCVSAFHSRNHQLQLISKPSGTRSTRYHNDVASYNSRISLANSNIDDDDANRDDDDEDLAEQFYNQLNK